MIQNRSPGINPPGPPPFGTLEVQNATTLVVQYVVELTLHPRTDEDAKGARPIRVHMHPRIARLMATRLLEAAQKADGAR